MTPNRPDTVAHCKELLASCLAEDLPELAASLISDDRPGVRHAVDAELKRRAAVAREVARLEGLLALERQLMTSGAAVIAGVDEVGRGALAGPVTAAAVVLGGTFPPAGLNDSKRLSPGRRDSIAAVLRETCVCWSVAHVGPARIDEIGIAAATREAMLAALAGLASRADHVLVDGLPVRTHPNETAVVGGDSKVACIAAASVVAKVARDSLMVRLAAEHPGWAFEVNKGYGTAEHIAEIVRRGPSRVHRRSFSPASELPLLPVTRR